MHERDMLKADSRYRPAVPVCLLSSSPLFAFMIANLYFRLMCYWKTTPYTMFCSKWKRDHSLSIT
jgi:hypothetical protein